MLTVNQKFAADWARTKNSIIIHYHPNYEDPHWGENSELLLAGTVAHFSSLITDEGLSEKVFQLSKKMAEFATRGIIANWEEGDEICPPPQPHWWWLKEHFTPQPEPWKEINAAEQVGIAYLFTKFSSLTINEEFNGALKSFATQIVQRIAGTIADEFEQCGTLPRPKPKMEII